MTVDKAVALAQHHSSAFYLALTHHKTHRGHPLDFKDHPYLKQLYLDKADYIVSMKSTQCGVSEWLLVNALGDSLDGRSVFYVLPTFQLSSRFVKNRYDRTIAWTEFYQKMEAEAELQKSKSMTLKHFGDGAIAFVGSNSAAVFGEFPADTLIVDELDFCDQANIEMGWERLSASESKRQIKISNPTIEGFGIDAEFKDSTQHRWHIKCDHCGNWLNPDFFKHVGELVDEGLFRVFDEEGYLDPGSDARLVCDKCGKPVDRRKSGEWVAANPTHPKHGYHISKLFSTNVSLKEIIDRYDRGLANDEIMTRVWNADFGLGYSSSGAKISQSILMDNIDDYAMAPSTGYSIAGVDVGKKLHVRISELLTDGRLRSVYIGTANELSDLAQLVKQYNVRVGVIDALPETRLSRRVAAQFPYWFMAYYGHVKKDVINPKDKIVTLNRTAAMDAVKEAQVMGWIRLPRNAASLPEYFDHMMAPTRILDRDKDEYIWTEGSQPDHFFHAEVYMLVAKKILSMVR